MRNPPEDTDTQYFLRELRHTPVGKRYTNACLMMKISLGRVQLLVDRARLGSISLALATPQVAHWRRIYIEHSNRASAALEKLMEDYCWPPESADGKRFTEARASALLKQGFRLTRITIPPKSSA